MIKCPECKAEIGKGTGVDIYKHAINCFHLPNEGSERLLSAHEGKDDERSRRITEVMTFAVQEA